MKTKIIILLIIFLISNNYVISQEKSNYYYFEGERIYLDIDYNTIGITYNKEYFNGTFRNGSNEYKIQNERKDFSPNAVIPLNIYTTARQQKESIFLGELKVNKILTQEEYYQMLREIGQGNGIIKANPTYMVNDKRMGVTANFYVRLNNTEDIQDLKKLADEYFIEILGYNEFMPLWITLSCTENTPYNAVEAANIFYESGLFECAEPEFIHYNMLASNDTYFKDQWGLKNTGQYGGRANTDIKVEDAWKITTGSTDIKTFIIDEGFEMTHPDLKNNVYGTGYDAVENKAGAKIYGPHGTAVAGIVSAVQNNSRGVSGVAPNSKIASISVSFGNSTTTQQLTNSISWASGNGADIINNSWGGGSPSDMMNDAIRMAFIRGRSGKGTVVVFATGNQGNSTIDYPAARSHSLVLAVGAINPWAERKRRGTGSSDGENWGSNFGTELDVVAPGVLVSTTDQSGNNGYNPNLNLHTRAGGTIVSSDYSDKAYTRVFNGTSAATPHVAGIAALVLSVNPNLRVEEVVDAIEETAQKVGAYSYTTHSVRPNGTWNSEMGYGLVNAAGAVNLAKNYNQTINSVVTSSATYHALNQITASSQISNNLNVTYKAKTVILRPGFKTTGTFRATSKSGNPYPSSARYNSIKEDFDYTDYYNMILNNAMGVEEFSLPREITITPNPTQGNFTVYLEKMQDGKIEILDISGKQIFTTGFNQQSEIDINIGNYPAGIYIIKVKAGNEVTTHRIIKI